MPSDFAEFDSGDLTASASLGVEHSGVCRTLDVPVVDMTHATRIRICTTWLKADIDGLDVELMSGSETGSPWLKLWVTLPDGRSVREGINVVDLVEAWAGAVAAGAGAQAMTAPGTPYWEGPVTDPTVLDGEWQGSVAIDDVGVVRQRTYGNRWLPSGWTQHGQATLSSRDLVRNGRPVWLLRIGPAGAGGRDG